MCNSLKILQITAKTMSEWNVWRSIDTALRIQNIFCVSPFSLDRSTAKLASSWKSKFYLFSVTSVILATMYLSVFQWHYMETLFKIEPNGRIWRILCIYEMGAINFHFTLNMIFVATGYSQQMQFLERIHAIDQQILNDFSASVDHRDYKRKLSYVLKFLYTYCGLQLILETSTFYAVGDYLLIPPTLAYMLQSLNLTAQIYSSTNYLFLIERRYRLLLLLHQKLNRDYMEYSEKSPTYNELIENAFLVKLVKLFKLHKQITKLIRLTEDIFGWIYASLVIKTFMTTLIQTYYIFITTIDSVSSGIERFYAYGFVYMLFGEFIKVILAVISIHSVYAAVSSLFEYSELISEHSFFFRLTNASMLSAILIEIRKTSKSDSW